MEKGGKETTQKVNTQRKHQSWNTGCDVRGEMRGSLEHVVYVALPVKVGCCCTGTSGHNVVKAIKLICRY